MNQTLRPAFYVIEALDICREIEMIRKLLKKKPAVKMNPTIDLGFLDQQLDNIRVRLLEIRGFRKKKVAKSPTLHFMKKIDLEEAWPSCRDTTHQMFALLCSVAQCFQVEFEAMPPTTSFGSALDQSVNLIDRIMLHLETSETAALSENELQTIDSNILKAQHAANTLQKHVMVEFVFMRNPVV
ncbi:hypothetical protein P4C99_00950 [Pontiellaceae bacterium B1224]|nr:hypothetical protein [Pontiellaceae bacterium B1224]